MYPDHIQRLQVDRIDAANDLHDAGAECRALFEDGPRDEYAAAVIREKAARLAHDEADQALSAALAEWRREGVEET